MRQSSQGRFSQRGFSQCGFSMIELSIALGIIGIVIGGIWAIAGSTRNDMLSTRIEQQTLSMVQNVRNYYASRALPTVAAAVTATLRAAGTFPEEMCPANCVSGGITTIYNAYGGTVTVAIPSVTAPINFFDVTYTTVNKKGCMALGMKLSTRSSELGLVSFDAGTSRTTFPIDLATLDTDCDSPTDTVVLRFKIRN